MCEVEILRKRILDLLENRIIPFDKSLLLVSDKKLDFKLAKDALSIKDLGIHVFQSILVVAGAVKNGDFREADYSLIPIDVKKISSARELVEYGEKVKAYTKEVINDLKEEDLDKEIKFSCWGGITAKIGMAVDNIAEELFHHRGQLCTYLRIMGIQPPSIYEYS